MRKIRKIISLISPIGPISPISLIGLIVLLLSACNRYEVERYISNESDVEFTYDWKTYFSDNQPNGLTVFFAKDGDVNKAEAPTYKIDGEMKKLESGNYKTIVMTNTINEYDGNLRFYSRNSHNDFMAYSTATTSADQDAWDKDRSYLNQPMKIGVAVDTFTIDKKVDDIVFFNWRDYEEGETYTYRRHFVIMPMTTTLYVNVKVRGIKYMRPAESGGIVGFISGMANGFSLSQRWRSKEVGNLRITNWASGYNGVAGARRANSADDDDDSNTGWVHGKVETFGLPHGKELLKQRTPESNFIVLHFTLLDGRTADFSYMVGKNIRYRGDDGTLEAFYQTDVTLELDLVIDAPFEVPILPYAQPSGSGQFDATVEPWGDDVNVDVPM